MRQPALGPHFILGQRRSTARRRLTLTLGQAMQVHSASLFATTAQAAASRGQRSWPAPTPRRAGHVSFGHMHAPDARTRQSAACRSKDERSAIRGSVISTPSTAGQFVGRASRGSAAPGNQRVVFRGARRCGAGGTSRAARTRQQLALMAGRHSAFMASCIKSNASRAQNAWPNPVFNRTPCGSPRMALISFWAKRGLPQGAG